MFLDLRKFLDHFPSKKMSRAEFIKKFKIMYPKPLNLNNAFIIGDIKMKHKGKMIIRKSLIKSENDIRYKNKEKIIDYFYQMIITHRHYYLKKFYEAYFAFKDPKQMKWDSLVDLRLEKEKIKDKYYKGDLSLQKNDTSRHIIRNLFYLELLHLTKITNTVKSEISFWDGLDNLYNRLELEDRFFAPSSIGLFIREKSSNKIPSDIPIAPKSFKGFNKRLNYHNLFYLMQGYQPKASIINPYFIHWTMENLFKFKNKTNRKLLTPVMSWGSYLVAYMHTKGWNEYVGIDVMKSVCKKTNYLAKYYNRSDEVNIYCEPSEKLFRDNKFMSKYKNYFDLIYICPPYYDMEIYHEGDQSIKLYKTYKEWLNGYWRPTVKLMYNCCMKGGYVAIIINNYYSLDGTYYPLVDDMCKIVKDEKFKMLGYYYLMNRTSPLRMNKKDRTERLMIFNK